VKTLRTLLALSALPVAAADISGAWKLEGNIADVRINRVCTIKQAGNKLSGGCKNQMNELSLTGEVNGNNVTWSYDADYQGQKLTLVFKGALETDTAIKGSITSEGVAGSFTATKQ
jgi:carbon monoxide dehydrogenase subunit G